MDSHPARALEAAQGYADLGMLEDAREILRSLPEALRGSTSCLQIELALALKESRWEDGLKLSRQLIRRDPRSTGAFIFQAYCLHELGRTLDAVDVLREGPEALRREPIYFYNLSCYRAQLGQFSEARQLLEKCFSIDARMRRIARTDPDLAPLWNSPESDGLL